MVSVKLSESVIGQVLCFLKFNCCVAGIVKTLSEQEVVISKLHIYRIKSGKSRQEDHTGSCVRSGPKRALSEHQRTSLVQQAMSANPSRQKVLSKEFRVSQPLISLNLKKQGLRKYKEPKGCRLTEPTIE